MQKLTRKNAICRVNHFREVKKLVSLYVKSLYINAIVGGAMENV